jgi:hypothetical protein
MSDNDIAMKDEPQVDLSVIARRQQQTLSAIRTLRDDFTFMAAIAQRMDGAIQGLVNEIRADLEGETQEGAFEVCFAFDDKTCERRSSAEMQAFIADMRAAANRHDFDLNQYGTRAAFARFFHDAFGPDGTYRSRPG